MKNEPNHNFSSDDWKICYVKPPRREKEIKIRISGGKARLNFGRTFGAGAANAGKKNKIWSIFVSAKVISGVKNKGYSGAFAGYIERPSECLASFGDSEASKKFNELDDKLLSQNPKRVIQKQLIISVPKEWLNDPDKYTEKFGKLLERKYFDVCYTWNMALHQGGDDFKNPHIHVIFSTVDANLKNIRDFNRANKAFLPAIKSDVRGFVSQELGIRAELKEYKKNKEPGAIKHYPKWVANALKRAEAAEQAGDGAKMMREYAEKYPIFAEYQDERRRKKLEKDISENIEKSKELLGGQKKIMSKMQKSIFLSRAGKEITFNELSELKKEEMEVCNFFKKKEKIQEPLLRPKQQAEREKTQTKEIVIGEYCRIFEKSAEGKILIRLEEKEIGDGGKALQEDLRYERAANLKKIFPDGKITKIEDKYQGLVEFELADTLENRKKLEMEVQKSDENIIGQQEYRYNAHQRLIHSEFEKNRKLQNQKTKERGGFER